MDSGHGAKSCSDTPNVYDRFVGISFTFITNETYLIYRMNLWTNTDFPDLSHARVNVPPVDLLGKPKTR